MLFSSFIMQTLTVTLEPKCYSNELDFFQLIKDKHRMPLFSDICKYGI